MKILLDTSIVVRIDRKDRDVIDLLKLLEKTHELYLSTMTIMEILTGSNLCRDADKATKKANKIMAQMVWVSVDASIAEKAGEINAFLITKGQKIELPDVLIAATCIAENMDAILTLNQDHFRRIPALENVVCSPSEMKKMLENGVQKEN
nr:type II toxin-antitoxin system VapC family toxin [Candidatus Sigynarchaeota archaeon]